MSFQRVKVSTPPSAARESKSVPMASTGAKSPATSSSRKLVFGKPLIVLGGGAQQRGVGRQTSSARIGVRSRPAAYCSHESVGLTVLSRLGGMLRFDRSVTIRMTLPCDECSSTVND